MRLDEGARRARPRRTAILPHELRHAGHGRLHERGGLVDPASHRGRPGAHHARRRGRRAVAGVARSLPRREGFRPRSRRQEGLLRQPREGRRQARGAGEGGAQEPEPVQAHRQARAPARLGRTRRREDGLRHGHETAQPAHRARGARAGVRGEGGLVGRAEVARQRGGAARGAPPPGGAPPGGGPPPPARGRPTPASRRRSPF